MTRPPSSVNAADFIRAWNRAAIERNGGVVITPRGVISAETAEQIRLAEGAGRPVTYVTRRHVRRLTVHPAGSREVA
ncbi:hypothetical protein ETD83_35890 [Actinomadura soli]|uniref:Uncharacterized protein n=1 Tax=Actinomadura soli TaxID=2508997 RepID=A0A5C4J0Z2_9ACTN|nr:hypothetical protein [Actinomadura soli]TMQ90337.1 hypothetical protein ETD83_35890 [Actinomadura soli]